MESDAQAGPGVEGGAGRVGAGSREQRKADRRRALLDAAARLFAERGYGAVSIADLGAAAEVSGPAVYRHFAGKQEVLVELLVGISERLLAGGQAERARAGDAAEALDRLVAAHVEFALTDTDLIRIQDRDLALLEPAPRRQVRRLQRRYVEIWVEVLTELDAQLSAEEARLRAHAVFGLINSTPHAAGPAALPGQRMRTVLRAMALAALRAPAAD